MTPDARPVYLANINSAYNTDGNVMLESQNSITSDEWPKDQKEGQKYIDDLFKNEFSGIDKNLKMEVTKLIYIHGQAENEYNIDNMNNPDQTVGRNLKHPLGRGYILKIYKPALESPRNVFLTMAHELIEIGLQFYKVSTNNRVVDYPASMWEFRNNPDKVQGKKDEDEYIKNKHINERIKKKGEKAYEFIKFLNIPYK